MIVVGGGVIESAADLLLEPAREELRKRALPPMNETPVLETHLVESAEEPGGVGEVSTVMIAPSLMNAIFAATGRRLRSLPVDPARLA